jgi:hypothetical protein
MLWSRLGGRFPFSQFSLNRARSESKFIFHKSQGPLIEPLLLTTTRVTTFDGKRLLTGASGFFFDRDGQLIEPWADKWDWIQLEGLFLPYREVRG